jgi:hypothetical protein
MAATVPRSDMLRRKYAILVDPDYPDAQPADRPEAAD